jgi:succinate-acetate transporter protein
MMVGLEDRKKPSSIALAINLAWASLALGFVRLAIDYQHMQSLAPVVVLISIFVFVFVITAFLVLKMSAGRNWARITFLVLFVIGVIPTIPMLLADFSRSAVSGAIGVIQAGLQLYALVLVFTEPGKHWFKKVVAP